MTSRREKEKNQLLERLIHWSIRHNLAADSYLNSIARSIEQGSSVTSLSKLDPESFLPRPRSTRGLPYIRTARVVAILRNCLVFLPVALTWKAVSEATRAFSEFITLNNAAPVNFLEFWQNGYNLLDPKWRIATVAEVDFWIIILIILMTLFASLILSYGQDLDFRTQRLLDEERREIIFEISLFLASPDVANPVAIDESLRNSLRNLNAVTHSLASAATKLEQSVLGQKKRVAETLEVTREFKTFQKKILKIIRDGSTSNKDRQKSQSSLEAEKSAGHERAL